MQRKWTIEIIADYSDKRSIEAMDEIMKVDGAKIYAKALLISDVQKPNIAIYSDDFFVGRTELDMLARALPAEIKQPDEAEDISEEMLEAMREMGKR